MEFKIVPPEAINDNVFGLIGNDWMLITAGEVKSFNMMTANWGGFGILWGKKICFCVIRPQRYTYKFMENFSSFTLSFFGKEYKDVLNFCGTTSGRDVDKVKKTGLTPVAGSSGTVFFKEARLVLICRKIYFQDINQLNFIDPQIHENYPHKDYHRMYIGEVIECLLKD